MQKKACRFMTAPYVGITQIRLWVEAFASSQPASASSPVHDLCNLCFHYSTVQGPAQGFFLPCGKIIQNPTYQAPRPCLFPITLRITAGNPAFLL